VSLLPISPWLCLRCGTSQRYGVEPEPCCPDRFVIRVLVNDPQLAHEHFDQLADVELEPDEC
jgi:hypothetical protein